MGGAEPRALQPGCPRRGGAAAASAQQSRGRQGPKLFCLGSGRRLPLLRRNGAAFSAARSNKRLRLPFKVCPSLLTHNSAQERARPPHQVQPPAGESPAPPPASRGRRLGGAAPPPRLEPPLAAASYFATFSTPRSFFSSKSSAPSFSQTADPRSESNRRLGAKSAASSFWKSSYTASEAAWPPCPRPGPGLSSPAQP